jgi:superfamily II DNA or RNA helicase
VESTSEAEPRRVSLAEALRGATTTAAPSPAQTEAALLSDDGATVIGVADREAPVRVVVKATALHQDVYRVSFACECAWRSGAARACRHVIAVAQAADERRGVRRTAPDTAAFSVPDPSLLQLAPTLAAGEFPTPVATAAAADWRVLLERVVRPPRHAAVPVDPAPARRPAEILYAVDATRTEFARTTLRVLERPWKKDGTRGALRPAQLRAADLPALPVEDRRILALLVGGGPDPAEAPGVPAAASEARTLRSAFALGPLLAETALPAAAAAGRLRLSLGAADVDPAPLAFDGRPGRRLGFRVERASEDDGYLVDFALSPPTPAAPEDREIPGVALQTLAADGWCVAEGVLYPVDVGALYDFAHVVRRSGRVRVPASEAEALLDLLLAAEDAPPLALPPELALTTTTVAPVPRLVLKPKPGERAEDGGDLLGVPSFDYEGRIVRPEERTPCFTDVRARRRLLRDRAAEATALAGVAALGMKRRRDGSFSLPRKRLVELALKLAAAGWRVEAEGRIYRAAGKLGLRVSTGVDWFDLRGAVDFEGRVASFPELLAAVRNGSNLVLLADGSVGALDEATAARLRRLAAFAETGEDGSLRFKHAQAGVLDALLAAEPDVTPDAAYADVRARLAAFAAPTPADPAPTFRGSLRPYQREGLGWIRMLDGLGAGGCLADDMGLGKTVQVLAHLDARRGRGPSLVVAPRSLLFNWRSEAAAFAPELRVYEHAAPTRPQDLASFSEAVRDADLVLTTYGLLRRDAPWLREFPFDYAILDEAQAVKNAAAASAKAARLLRARRRLALSGTPVENRVAELWSLFAFLEPGLLGASRAFEAALAKDADPETLAALGRALRPYLLRRTKAQVAPDLPAKTEQTILVELEGEDRRLYEEMRDHYRAALLGRAPVAAGAGRGKLEVLTALLRLRQAACHPGLLDAARAARGSAKLEALVPALRELVDGGHKALVFSQFTSFLDLVEPRLREEGIGFERLDGSTLDRERRVERFRRDPEAPVFLISLKAGGLGLNLVEADYVFLLDPWWNPAVEAQAIDRAHRIGQTRPVTAYRIVARDTVEERILELQRSKRALADAVVRAEEGGLTDLGPEDLELLFR